MVFFKKIKLAGLLKRVKKLHAMREQGKGTGFQEEIAALIELAQLYDQYKFNKYFPNAETLAIEYYRAAASLDAPKAQYILSQRLFDKAKFYEQWSHNNYGSSIHQKYAFAYYEEAFNYLKESEKSGYALAKRYHGLCYINGWGVDKNLETGFQMIIDSIEMEKAWDKVTKILDELGLNSPEFFNSIMRQKANKNDSE
ncbi:MAG: hypothetical protein LEGION0398_MBIBDBAK_00308 [Legionellaceae bacterium]